MKNTRYQHLLMLALSALMALPATAQTDRQLLRSGNRFFHHQDYAKAEVEYRKALAQNPRNAQAVYNLGCALLMQQKDSAAITQFQQSGKMETIKARKAMSYHNIGVVCQKHQLYADAIKAYEESLRNNPDDNQTRYNLALCKRLLKNNPQNNNKNNQKKKNKDQQQNKKNKQQDKQQQSKQQQKQDKQMSKDNAEQLLNAAIQEEQATQQRIKKAMQQAPRRRLEKNW